MVTKTGFRTLTVYTYAVLAMLFWGLSFVWFKLVIVAYDPITIIFLRLLISSFLLAVFQLITRNFQRIKWDDLKWFLLLAFTQPFCYFMGESFGLRLVSSTVSSVIISTIPLFSPIAAYMAFRERITSDVLTGILFSFLGIMIMLINPDLSFTSNPKGVLFLFLAVFSAVAYSVVIRKLAFKYHPATIIMLQNLIGAIYFLPLFLVFDLKGFMLIHPGKDVLFALLELSFFASTFSYLFYIIAIKEIGVVKSNILTNLIPIFTAVFSFFVLAERFTIAKVIGMAIVMSGIVISQYKSIKLMMNRRIN
ncbi:MAG: DMT family transporter [Bacteroidetes bacterium]|nr:DMT family transporter [Bacteroidota bacterium]